MGNLTGKRVLVTGAGGFIGSHVTEALVREGASVIGFVHYNSRNDWGNLELLEEEIRKEVNVFAGDVTDPFSVRTAALDSEIIFHLAALIGIPYSYTAPASYVAVNVTGTLNVMEAARETGARVVHTSTSETYGSAQYVPIDEKHPLVGQSPYSASKIAADKIVESYYRSFDMPVVTVRPFNNYGPRQSARAVIPTIISQVVSGFPEIKLGLTTPIRDLLYVSDTARGYMLAASSQEAEGETINLGYGKGITIGDLARMIIEISGKDVSVVSDESRVRPEKSEVTQLIADNTKAKALLGWEPRVELREGLERCYAYIRDNLSLFKPEIYNV